MMQVSQGSEIDDLPQRVRLRVLPRKWTRVEAGLDPAELERLSLQRLWRPILDLPVPAGGDDCEPRPPDPREDKYGGT